jgi:hypothetical protein
MNASRRLRLDAMPEESSENKEPRWVFDPVGKL